MRKGIQSIFSEVAETYELVNHVLTFGLDILWRKKAAHIASRAGGTLWMDVCSGTGEMAFNLSRQAGEKVNVISVDFCYPMFAKAQKKKKNKKSSVYFTQADAGSLPFQNETFDLVTISFGTRNINPDKGTLRNHLKEFYRVLKPGGRFVNLETSQPSAKIIQKLFHLYIKLTVKHIGYLISGSKAGYKYLAFTIPRFYSPEEFSSILHETGFYRVTYHPLFFGVSAIHFAKK